MNGIGQGRWDAHRSHGQRAGPYLLRAAGPKLPTLGLAPAVVVELSGGLLVVAVLRTRIVATAFVPVFACNAVSFHSNFVDQNHMIHVPQERDDRRRAAPDRRVWRGALSIDNRGAKGGAQAAS